LASPVALSKAPWGFCYVDWIYTCHVTEAIPSPIVRFRTELGEL